MNFQYHISECPDKASLDRYKYTSETGRENIFREPVPPIFHEVVESEECWDNVSYS